MLPAHLYRLFAFVLEVWIHGMALILAASAAALVLRRSSASVRALLWRLTLFGLAALPLLSIALPPLPISVPVAAVSQPSGAVLAPEAATGVGLAAARDAQPRGDAGRGDASEPSPRPPYAPVRATPAEPVLAQAPPMPFPPTGLLGILFPWLLILWTLGAIALFGRCAAGMRALRQVAGQSAAASDVVREAAGGATREIGVRVPVSIRVAAARQRLASPMTWGIFRPVLLLPRGTESWPDGRLRAVLLHELAHIARGDWAAGIMADIVCALYWPNPLAWFAAHRMRRETEMACDDRVLNCGVRGSDYATHLLEIVRMQKRASSLYKGGIAMAEPSLLETRLRAALDSGRSRRAPSRAGRIALAAAFMLALLPLGALRLTATPAAPATVLAAGIASESTYPSQSLPEMALPAFILRSPPVQTVPITAPRIPELEAHKIAWGRSAHGLQAGIERTDGQRAVLLGQHVGLRLWIRNTGRRTLVVRFLTMDRRYARDRPFFWNVMTVNSASIQVTLQLADTGERNSGALYLKPNEERVLPMPDPTFVAAPIGNSTVTEPTAFVSPGRKQVQVFPFAVLAPEDAWMRAMGTGKISLDVTGSPISASADARDQTPMVSAGARHAAGEAGIAWGKEVGGLQAGLRGQSGHTSYPLGATVAMDYVIRNVGNREIAFSHDVFPGVAGIVPEVVRANGKPAYTFGLPLGATSELKRETLKPGEMVVLGQTAMGIGGDGVPWYSSRPGNMAIKDTGEKAYTYLDARSEAYRIRHLYTVVRTDTSRQVLYTGYLPLEVFDPTAWGKAKNGLQAGIRLSQSRRWYVRGATVDMDYLVRNAAASDLPFQFAVSPTYSFDPIRITGPTGKRLSLTPPGADRLSEPQMKTVTLKPGETIVIGHPRIILGDDIRFVGSTAWDGPGLYRLAQSVGELESGEVEFGVAASDDGRTHFSIGKVF